MKLVKIILALVVVISAVFLEEQAYAQLVWNPSNYAPLVNPPGGQNNYLPINNPTWTGTMSAPGSQSWTNAGIVVLSVTLPAGQIINNMGATLTTLNLTGTTNPLTFNGVPMGGTCTGNDFVNAISARGVPTCATPAGGGEGGGIPVPVSIANGGLGQGATPTVGDILVAATTTTYVPTDPTTLFPPMVNPTGGQNNYAPLASPTFTGASYMASLQVGNTLTAATLSAGTITVNNAGILMLAGSAQLYFNGVPPGGTCPAGQFVTAISSTVIPTCAPAGVIVAATAPASPETGQLWFNSVDLQTYIRYTGQWVPIVNMGGGGGGGGTIPPGTTIDSPILIGKIEFPDGSYYDTNGHEVMKNLGVGVVAQTAGVGGVDGSSIVVKDSGWWPPNGGRTNGYWDAGGLEQLYSVDSEWITVPNPIGGQILVQTDPNNAANDYPYGVFSVNNQSVLCQGPDCGGTQNWQAEGLETIVALGINSNTWNAQLGCNQDETSFMGNCAVAAVASQLNNNLNYQIVLANFGKGPNAATTYMLRNDFPHSAYISLTNTTYQGATAIGDQFALASDATNGISIISQNQITAVFTPAGEMLQGVLYLPNTTGSTIYLGGTQTQPNSAIFAGSSNNMTLTSGAHNAGASGWIADATSPSIIGLYGANGQGISFYGDTGKTIGSSFIPSLIGTWNPTGLNILSGNLFIGNRAQFRQGSWTPQMSCTGGPPQNDFSGTGWYETVGNIVFFVASGGWSTTTGGAGNGTLNGLPFDALDPTGAGYRAEAVISNAYPNNGDQTLRLVATVYGGSSIVQFNQTNFGSIGYLVPMPCNQLWPNQGSGLWINGWYKFQ